MARIVIFGGHGKVARLLAPLLSARGDRVTAVIRNPEHADDVRTTGAQPVVFDVEQQDLAAIAELLSGADAVVWSAGAGGGDAARTRAVDHDAAVRSMDAAKDAGVRRYVMVSYFGASPDHGIPADDPFHAYAEAKAAADEHLRASGLDWTILAPSRLNLGEATGRVDTAADESGEVSRADVAHVIAETLLADATIHRTLRFNAGDQPIAGALRA
ncbi:SDR family oxidoreductase [Microbacterium sp. NPDC089318]